MIPALIVAILCLLRDEGIVSFLKKVGGTYVFFWLLSSVYGYFWRLASYRAPEPKRKASDKKRSEAKK